MNKILLIENEEVGKYYKDLLEISIENLEIIWLRNKKEVLDFFCGGDDIKVIVFDQRLDNGELGINIMTELKQVHPNILGIMLSAYALPNDATHAIKENIIFEYVNKNDIDMLPAKVVDALRYYDVKRMLDVKKNKQFIGRIYKKGNIFHPLKLYITSKILVDDNYVFEDRWEELYVINAGEEQCHKKSIEISSNVKVENGLSVDNSFEIEVEKVRKLIGGSFNNEIEISKKETDEISSKAIDEVVRTYKMPSIPQSVEEDYLTTTIFEGAQVFKKYQLIVEQECPLCGEYVYYSFDVFLPTNGKRLRKINTYKSGKQENIEVSLKK